MTEGPTIGELFAGYGGLGMGVQSAIGGRVLWTSEIEPAPCRVLAHRYPDAPNIGDVTTVDWSTVPPVQVLTGGFPCQDVSQAGLRAGLTDGTRSGLWAHFAAAIDALRPELVVIENVRGLLHAESVGPVEPCPWCVGDGPGVDLRALGTVLADLARLGLDAEWCGVPAAKVGAPHGRYRIFILAWPAVPDAEGPRLEGVRGPRDAAPSPGHRATPDRRRRRSGARAEHPALLPTPTASDVNGTGVHGDGGLDLRTAISLLPTPTASDHTSSGGGYNGQTNVTLTDAVVRNPGQWGDYADAVARWEWFTRPAPPPTVEAPRGGRRLSPRFSEWMMGIPDGWVTDVPGVSWAEAVKLCGNGVVPDQAAHAVRTLLARVGVAA